MPKQDQPTRPLWQDRFREPEIDDLVAAISRDHRGHFTKLRTTLSQREELEETLEWCGLPWRWALLYRREGESEPVAYLVPNPETPAAVMRLTHEEAKELPVRKLSRYVRDGLASARLVAGICWPEWQVQAASNANDLGQLFKRLSQARLAPSA